MNCIVVNLFGGSGIGKTAQAYYLSYLCKIHGLNIEYVDEYVKPMVYEERKGIFECQDYIFGKQLFKIQRAAKKVDVVITDCPVLLSAVYDPEHDYYLRNRIIKKFNQFNNLNFILNRHDDYFRSEGRLQKDVKEAKETDAIIKNLLKLYNIDYKVCEPSEKGMEEVFESIINRLKEQEGNN